MKIRYILLIFIAFIINIRVNAVGENIKIQLNNLDTDLKLYDNADIFSSVEEEQIKKKIDDYIDKYQMDLVIVTTSINTYSNTETFMEHFYQDNNFGKTSKKDGTIMAIDLDNKTYEFISYGEMQRYLDDKRIDDIYDYVDQMYKDNNKDYYVLAISFIDELDYYVSLGIPSSNKNTYVSSDGIMHENKVFPWILTIIISAVISLIVVLIFAYKSKMIKKAKNANNYLDTKTINITNRTDRFITTHTTRMRKSDNSSSGGGSKVGGTSISGNHSSGHGGRSL